MGTAVAFAPRQALQQVSIGQQITSKPPTCRIRLSNGPPTVNPASHHRYERGIVSPLSRATATNQSSGARMSLPALSPTTVSRALHDVRNGGDVDTGVPSQALKYGKNGRSGDNQPGGRSTLRAASLFASPTCCQKSIDVRLAALTNVIARMICSAQARSKAREPPGRQNQSCTPAIFPCTYTHLAVLCGDGLPTCSFFLNSGTPS